MRLNSSENNDKKLQRLSKKEKKLAGNRLRADRTTEILCCPHSPTRLVSSDILLPQHLSVL